MIAFYNDVGACSRNGCAKTAPDFYTGGPLCVAIVNSIPAVIMGSIVLYRNTVKRRIAMQADTSSSAIAKLPVLDGKILSEVRGTAIVVDTCKIGKRYIDTIHDNILGIEKLNPKGIGATKE